MTQILRTETTLTLSNTRRVSATINLFSIPLEVNIATVPAEFEIAVTDLRFDAGMRNEFRNVRPL